MESNPLELSTYLDQRGYPGTRQGDGTWDGGDTAADLGTIKALGGPLSTRLLSMPYNHTYGVPLRHWDTTKWYGQPDRFSRDQLIPTLCGFLNMKAYSGQQVEDFYRAHKRRYFIFAWNIKGNSEDSNYKMMADICGPEVWALWIRLQEPRFRHLYLWFLDIQTLIGAIQWRLFPKNQITRNHMLVSLAILEHSPTITSYLVNKINNWPDLIDRWRKCNTATGEYPTADLFQARKQQEKT